MSLATECKEIQAEVLQLVAAHQRLQREPVFGKQARARQDARLDAINVEIIRMTALLETKAKAGKDHDE